MNPGLIIGLAVLGAIILGVAGFFLGNFHRKRVAESTIGTAEDEAARIVNEAMNAAKTQKKEALIEAKDEIHKLRSDNEREMRERRSEVVRQEKRMIQKEESLDRKAAKIEKKEETLQQKEKEAQGHLEEIDQMKRSQLEMLERISSLTKEQARVELLDRLEQDLVHEKAVKVMEYEQQLHDEQDDLAREVLSTAIQRCAADHSADATVSVVSLPNDEMKGRIIGREGRNIRALETATGVDLIIDDTPEAITLSSFDPVRREIARVALEKLIQDGRIHPARIEEMVEKARKEVELIIKQAGEHAVIEADIGRVHPEIVKLLGRLKFRTSYGQNVLNHSLEVAHIAGLMAAEVHADVRTAKRAGLLHDIGKALDHELDGSHIQIGVEFAKRYKEKDAVVHAIEAHHGDVEAKTAVAALVQAADAVSAARPGARRENVQNYIKRLEQLEAIANSFDGVEQSYAIQAGREVRILVKPDEVNDDQMTLVARDVVKRIEDELEYPGQIKVNIIRENRAISYAK